MLHPLLYASWEMPPPSVAFEFSYEVLLQELSQRTQRVLTGLSCALKAPQSMPDTYFHDCLMLYVMVPGLVNVALNYKVCIEQGLPMHPTCYFQLNEKERFQMRYDGNQVAHAQTFFLKAIETARALYQLASDAQEQLKQLEACVPEVIRPFIYINHPDKYTWRASDPKKIQTLAQEIRHSLHPKLLLGAAHGAIMPGLLLANLLNVPLYFIRFSLFKRKDTAPVIAPSDLCYLTAFKTEPVILFDEDIAKGTTLSQFTQFLKPFFQQPYSAGILMHRHAAFKPDFIGHVWSD